MEKTLGVWNKKEEKWRQYLSVLLRCALFQLISAAVREYPEVVILWRKEVCLSHGSSRWDVLELAATKPPVLRVKCIWKGRDNLINDNLFERELTYSVKSYINPFIKQYPH